MKDLSAGYLYDFYAGVLTGRASEVMAMYYHEDFSLGEIADNLKISRQGVKDFIDRSVKTLNGLETATGAYARYRLSCDFLAACAKELENGGEGKEAVERIKEFLREY